MVFIPLRWGFTLEPVYLYFIRQPEQLASAALRHREIKKWRIYNWSNKPLPITLPATPESCDFLHQIKIGEWIHADFKRVRNYAFHKRFFKLLQLGFDYWTPVGGAITPRERELLSGFVDYLCESVGREHTPALSEAAEQYLNTVATRRTRDTALLKSFEAFREWVIIQAGFYTEHFYPDGSHGRRAKSIAFANMDETEFQQVYKSVLNVLWNWILFRKFSSPEQVENVAAQLLEFA